MKKFVSILLCAVLLMTVGMSAALAERTPSKQEMRQLEMMVVSANQQIQVMVIAAQLTPWDDVCWLKCSTDLVAQSVKSYARCIGATVVCEYTSYWVDGRLVDIDPLRVVHDDYGDEKKNPSGGTGK